MVFEIFLLPCPQKDQRWKSVLCQCQVRDKGFFVKKVSYKQIDDPTDVRNLVIFELGV